MAILDRELLNRGRHQRGKRGASARLAFLAISLTLCIIGSLAILHLRAADSVSGSPLPARASLLPHSPILIEGNGGFLGDNSSTGVARGSGTESDPYVIEDWDIIPAGWRGIWIRGADVHFVVQDCHIHDYTGPGIRQAGIYVEWCSNATLQNNTIDKCGQRGIWLEGPYNDYAGTYSTNCTVIGNSCSNNSEAGILVVHMKKCAFVNNTCRNNTWGISIGGVAYDNEITNNEFTGGSLGIMLLTANDNDLIGNNCSSCSWAGILLEMSNGNNIVNNSCSRNLNGIYLYNASWQGACNDNMIQLNRISSNTNFGIMIGDGNANNRIWNNSLAGNHGSGPAYESDHAQASDNGTGNWWNSSDGYGNYWSEWTAPDLDANGIVDVPYNLSGTAASMDNYPRTTPSQLIPEFGSGAVFGALLVFLAAIAMSRTSPRRGPPKRKEEKV